jgi:hypothetical protein
MAQVVGQLGDTLGREVAMTEMFQYPTIRALAEYLEGNGDGGRQAVGVSQERGAGRRDRMRRRRHATSR